MGQREGDIFQNVVAELRMLLEQVELRGGEQAGLGENFSGDADFAEVVNAGGEMEAVGAIVGQAELLRNAHAEIGDSAFVAGGVGIALVHGFGDDMDGLLQSGAEVSPGAGSWKSPHAGFRCRKRGPMRFAPSIYVRSRCGYWAISAKTARLARAPSVRGKGSAIAMR